MTTFLRRGDGLRSWFRSGVVLRRRLKNLNETFPTSRRQRRPVRRRCLRQPLSRSPFCPRPLPPVPSLSLAPSLPKEAGAAALPREGIPPLHTLPHAPTYTTYARPHARTHTSYARSHTDKTKHTRVRRRRCSPTSPRVSCHESRKSPPPHPTSSSNAAGRRKS